MQGAKPPSYQRMMSSQYMRAHNKAVQQDMAGNKARRDTFLYPFTNVAFGGPAGLLGAPTGYGWIGSVANAGPTLNQLITNGVTSTDDTSWKNNTAFLNVTSTGIILWTVPSTGMYRIEIWGARGGNQSSGNYPGGYGARMRGDFSLNVGQVLKILVGQQGGASYAGGGGGTFVATDMNIPLIVAGGGNSASAWSSVASHAPTTTSGLNGTLGDSGGTNGNGGLCNAGAVNGAAGGAGFYGNGGNSSCASSVVPLSFVNGGTGGTTCNSIGGFGGGSASDGCCQGASGAGGGYSGGGGAGSASNAGGAGGSYNIGNNQSNDAGNTGTATLPYSGRCVITRI
jgi:hypothetical protein